MNNDKIINVQQALDLIKSDDVIVTGLGAGEARLILSELHTIANRVHNVTVTNCLPMNHFEFMESDYKDSFYIDGWFFSPDLRKSFPNGNVSFIPNHLHFSATKRLAHRKPNVYIGSASSIDKHGYVSLSCSNTYERRMLEAADLVILEVNPNFPRTYGDVEIHLRDIDYVIETDYEVPALLDVIPNEKDEIIGKLIAEEVMDGDTIQLGIGGIPNAVAEQLVNKKNLGVHTEMMTSNMAKLAKMGVINGKNKSLHPGKIVTTFILGNQELYEFCDDNPSVLVLDGYYVNDPYTIAMNDNMVSINTAIEVDLTGQCASESIGTKQISGTGGQTDTAVGAQNAKNGRSYIALYSTAMVKNPETGEREEISKIVTTLKQGAAVTLSRNDVDRVVTEYGIAELRGTNIRERVERLIAIAHPKFREALYQEAKDAGIIA